LLDQVFDPEVWQQARKPLMLVLILLFVLAWLVCVICVIGIFFCVVPGSLPKQFSLRSWFKPASFRDWMLLNRLNVIFYSELLTPMGLVFRRCLIISFVAMPIILVALFLLVPSHLNS
jgi:hypothetical protein